MAIAEYSSITIHREMVADQVRGNAFRKALEALVTPDSIVLDVGAGTGFLGLMAANAGARHTYLVERTPMVQVARELIQENGLEDRCTVLEQSADDIELPEKVDIFVSELLGGLALDEGILPVMTRIRDKWLKPGGAMVPDFLRVWMAPALDEKVVEEAAFWTGTPFGLSMKTMARYAFREMLYRGNHISAACLAAPAQVFGEYDLLTYDAGDAQTERSNTFEYTFEESKPFNGIATWFECSLGGKAEISTAPGNPDTHWGRYLLPMPLGETFIPEPGETLSVRVAVTPHGETKFGVSWEVKFREQTCCNADSMNFI